ncbi:MAG: ribulose-phosphate 3-epimerase [Eubacterium sp.]|jgi:ribulose-phosphate 3-epimerase|nr:ribulose-phosphate 3-epimerase [Eubacterium sp.]
MNILAPSMLSIDFNHMEDNLREVYEAGATHLHVDIMDGTFVPNISFGPPVIKFVRRAVPDVKMDVHLMVQEPIRLIQRWAKLGADIITFHAEAAVDLQGMIDAIHAEGMKAGIALKPATPVSSIEEVVKDLDMILIMSVEPGFGGQKFMPVALDKIRETRALLDEYGLKTDIEVDGGITLQNVDEVLGAGANVIVAGSAIFNENPGENVRKFKKHLNG